jgi:hypothetical protein
MAPSHYFSYSKIAIAGENSAPSLAVASRSDGQHSFQAGSNWPSGVILTIVLLLSGLSLACLLKRGWVPHDDGILALSAERVLQGELPHRDYIDIYTGALTYLNASAFRIFGVSLASMRYVLFLFFLPWVATFYYLARRFVSAPVAGGVTLLAVVWSVPNYPAAMPSWYNLFFATFGLAALFRYIETERRPWLFAAGLCGGISILFKITGLYFVAGALLFLFFRERLAKSSGGDRSGFVSYRVFVLGALGLFECIVFLTLRRIGGPTTLLYFWTPELAIAGAIVWLEFHTTESRTQRFSYLFRELIPFTAGVALPMAIFLIPYVLTGRVSNVVGGISVSVGAHISYVFENPSTAKFIVGASIDLLLMSAVFLSRSAVVRATTALFLLGTPVVLFLAYSWPYADRAVWGTMWSLLPVAVVVGAILVARWSTEGMLDKTQQQQIFLALSVTAACSLIQFPFTIPIYYCYVAPFVFLSLTAIISQVSRPPKWALVGALCFALSYMLLIIMPGFIVNMAQRYSSDKQLGRLSFTRAGGLRVYPSEAREYTALTALVQSHSHSKYIYAAPECPEIYFLTASRDPFPLSSPTGATEGEVREILDTLHEHGVNLVVLNQSPQFSQGPPANLESFMKREFPFVAQVGSFEVRWREQ